MDSAQVGAWVAGYERAWRTAGTSGLDALFTADATYLQGPYRAPVVGLPAIAAMWDAERDGPDEGFEMAYEVVAVDGDTAVARLWVRYLEGTAREYQDLWILRFAGDGRCRYFEEWPVAAPRSAS